MMGGWRTAGDLRMRLMVGVLVLKPREAMTAGDE